MPIPVLAYGFEENTGTSFAPTYGSGVGARNGQNWKSGVHGSALGRNTTGELPAVVQGAPLLNSAGWTSFTLMFWLKPQDPGSGLDIFPIALLNGSADWAGIALNTAGHLIGWLGPNNLNGSPGTAPMGVWSHISLVWTGTTLSSYINGVLQETVPVTGGINTLTSLYIGGAPWSPTGGDIDDLRIFDSALSQPEIATLMDLAVGDEEPEEVELALVSSLNTLYSGANFSQNILASGNDASFTVSAGSLPEGISLNSSTGVLSGTPSFAWNYSFTIRAENESESTEQQYTGYINLPSETGRTIQNTGLATYARIELSIEGDAVVLCVPTNHPADTPSVVIAMAHGIGDTEQFIDNEPRFTRNYAIEQGWIVASALARGDAVGSNNAQEAWDDTFTTIKTVWPINDLVLYGASMGALTFLNSMAQERFENVRGLVGIDSPVSLRWLWDLGEQNRNGIRAAYEISNDNEYATKTAGYDPALYPPSAWTGRKLFLSWSYNDTVIPPNDHSLPFIQSISNTATVTSHQSTGVHYAQSNFAASEVNAFIASLFAPEVPEPPAPVSYALGDTPVTLALGDIPVEAGYFN